MTALAPDVCHKGTMLRTPLTATRRSNTLSYRIMKRPSLACLTAMAMSSSVAQAFVISASTTTTTTTPTTSATTQTRNYNTHSNRFPHLTSLDPYTHKSNYRPRTTTTRLYSSGKEEGFLSKIGNAVKSILPTKIFGSKEEKQALARKKEYRNQISGGLNEVLKDAPLGIRMMGKMVSPLLSSMASTLADTMAEQQRTTEGLMDDARGYLMGDPAVTKLLGEPISLGTPFSQASSTTSINGKTQTRVELGVPVSGSRTSGTIRLLATQDGISQMTLDAGGRSMNVSLSRKSSSYFGSSGYKVNGDDNVIEAEVIDKTTK